MKFVILCLLVGLSLLLYEPSKAIDYARKNFHQSGPYYTDIYSVKGLECAIFIS